MPKIDYILFQYKADAFLEYIARCKSDLEKYAERPDAKDSYIDKRNEEIATMYRYYENSTNTVDKLYTDAHDEYSRGIDAGYAQKEKEIADIPPRYSDKEAERGYSIQRAATKWPELT